MMYNLIMNIEYTVVSLKINDDTTAVMYNTQNVISINSFLFLPYLIIFFNVAWSAYYIKIITFYSNKAYITCDRLRLLSTT